MSSQPSRTLTHLASTAGHCDVHLSVLTSKVSCINKLTEVGEKQKKMLQTPSAQRGAAVSDKSLDLCSGNDTPNTQTRNVIKI